MNTTGAQFFAAVVDSPKGLDEYINAAVTREMFLEVEQSLFDFVEAHIKEHGAVPHRQTILTELGIELPQTVEPPSYYVKYVDEAYRHKAMKVSVMGVKDCLNSKDVKGAEEKIKDCAAMLSQHNHRAQVVDFGSKAADTIEKHIAQSELNQALGNQLGIMSGWKYLDDMSGGLVPGDLLTVIGRPQKGKTFLGLKMARHAWWRQHRDVMFVSMEMLPLLLMQRLTAMHVKVSAKKVKQGTGIVTKTKQKIITELTSLQEYEPKFWIIDGNLTASITDIQMLAYQLQPALIVIDGAYLLTPTDKFAKNKITDTCEGMKKDLATNLQVPVIGSYQFNRELEGLKSKKDKDKMKNDSGLHHIYGSDAVGQLSSIVLGLFEDELEEDSTQQLTTKKTIKILKGRSGETGEFDINWIFDVFPFMNFDQVEDPYSQWGEGTALSYPSDEADKDYHAVPAFGGDDYVNI